MLETIRNLRNLPILRCARLLKRRAHLKIGELERLWCLAYKPYSPTRRARGGQKRYVVQRVRRESVIDADTFTIQRPLSV